MNYFQVENYVNYGNPNGLAVIRKSDSDKALNKNNSSEGGGGKGSTPKKGSSKKNKRKNFKRSLTMTALPLAFFKGQSKALTVFGMSCGGLLSRVSQI